MAGFLQPLVLDDAHRPGAGSSRARPGNPQRVHQLWEDGAVVEVSGRGHEYEGQPVAVDREVDFAGRPAVGSSESAAVSLDVAFLRAPTACRRARTIVEPMPRGRGTAALPQPRLRCRPPVGAARPRRRHRVAVHPGHAVAAVPGRDRAGGQARCCGRSGSPSRAAAGVAGDAVRRGQFQAERRMKARRSTSSPMEKP